jgi:predicted enzyme related to lactoylglutathione lyase
MSTDAEANEPVHHSINYIELPATDLGAMKTFYGDVFGWTFVDWGDTYVAIHGAGVEGGFDLDAGERAPSDQGALVILYSADLDASLRAVESAGGTITRQPFSFPGGRRFHFNDPSGNGLAIWIHENNE